MVRLARPTLHWLLWLVIALLPLRGWAMAQMAAVPVVSSATVQAAETAAADALPPCHAGMSDTQAAPTHAGCSLCEVCHASLGLPAVTELHLPTLPHAAPAVTPTTGVRDGPPSELFRPPRRPA